MESEENVSEVIRAGRFRIPVIYEDNHLLVVEKPPNLPTQADPQRLGGMSCWRWERRS